MIIFINLPILYYALTIDISKFQRSTERTMDDVAMDGWDCGKHPEVAKLRFYVTPSIHNTTI